MSRIIIFDLDGTLVDTAPDLVASLNATLALEGIPPVALQDARHMVGAGVKALLERGLALSGRSLPEKRLDELFHSFVAYYEAHIADFSQPYPELLEELAILEGFGWTFGVCTNKLERLSIRLLDRLGMTELFKVNCGGDTFDFKKPDPRHLTETIRKAGGARTAVMVGDSHADVAAAKAAGIPVIGVTFGYTPVPMAELGPDVMIDRFSQLRAAVSQVTGGN